MKFDVYKRTAKKFLHYWYIATPIHLLVGAGLVYWYTHFLDVLVWLTGSDPSGGWKYFLSSFLVVPLMYIIIAYWLLVTVFVIYTAIFLPRKERRRK
ncbi:hypothetical protein MNQ98_12070 [Paenibacillus sp. N3/727]|uniref:hypothetical protein n=1 Tax=Paenibacillus sp. N3/727 TaxID=2925845 RepID=UPI001F532DBA|nr:hypothetical protein [Paenibacillus sp. N3/727]UNK20697.1 hypothetical protein MNQ98_12070 [Paenibacillus sp. N3/727]